MDAAANVVRTKAMAEIPTAIFSLAVSLWKAIIGDGKLGPIPKPAIML